ncbi:YedE-related selenium metabolism membrane protein [candidate division WOR-3 bacterium]|nr:YedE-related selenium metabolism membrane protein [candidate division WOR-3 bacterium]
MVGKITGFFASKWGIVLSGGIIGIIAVLLQKFGNPQNMGVCVACFERDIAGALGLHRNPAVQYIRPEIIGFVLGSMISALIFREFKPRSGSSPLVRFFLGMFAMIGALVFLGCPWRAFLRLSAGDGNAVSGIFGLITGVSTGSYFLKKGFSLGRNIKTSWAGGLIFPLFMILLLAFLAFKVSFGEGAPIFFSETGPGSKYAPLILSLGAGLLIGFLAQRSRFCTMGAVRDVVLIRDWHLISGVGALVVAAFILNIVFKQFHPGFALQPVSHSFHIWNFLGMALSGLAFALAGGCPGRQLFLSGEGDQDAGLFVMGMIVGAGFSHNFLMAASPDKLNEAGNLVIGGPGIFGKYAVVAGLIFCVILGLTMKNIREKKGA